MNREDVAMDVTFENLDILRKEVEAAKLLLSECDEIFIEEGISNIELRGYLSGKLSADEVIELLDPPAEQRNQCDGCQAGIPLVDGAHRMGRPGGYPDLMSCQKERYKHPEQAEGAQGEREAFEAHESRERRLSPADQKFWFRRGAVADYDIKSIDDAWKAWKARAAQDVLMAEGTQGELLPCPFCGGQAHLTYDDYVHDDLRPMPVVECNACHTWVRAESWNKRAAQARVAEPVHWRAMLDPNEIPQQLNRHMHIAGFVTQRAAEDWIAERRDFDGWHYTLQPLYAAPVAQAGQVPLSLQFVNAVKQLCKDFADRQDRPYMGNVFSALDALLVNEQIPVAQVGKVPDALREAVEYLDSNPFNEIGSGSILHRQMRDAIAGAPAQGGCDD